MPKDTPFKRMSKADLAEYLKTRPKTAAPLRPKPQVRVAAPAAPAAPKDPEPKDGLAWLLKKKRLSSAQLREGMKLRQGFKDAEAGASVRSCLEGGVGGGSTIAVPQAAAFTVTAAQQELFVVLHRVLRGQDDMIAAVEGVCGKGLTPRFMAGGNQLRATEIEAALRIALDLVMDWRADLKKAA